MKSPNTEKAKKDRLTVKAITDVATGISGKIDKLTKPEIAFPIRSLSNVRYTTKKGYFEIGKDKSTAHADRQHVQGAGRDQRLRDQAGRLLPVEELGRGDVRRADRVGHGDGRHRGDVLDPRRQPRAAALHPDEHGGAVAGELIVYDTDLESGKTERSTARASAPAPTRSRRWSST